VIAKTDSVAIPKWFLTVGSLIMMGAIPWAFTISLKLNTLAVKMETTVEVKKKFERHLENHISQAEIKELRRRIEKLEK